MPEIGVIETHGENGRSINGSWTPWGLTITMSKATGIIKPHIALLLAIWIGLGCSRAKPPDKLIKGGYDQQEMDAAIARARSEVDSFIAELSHGNGTDFAVKAEVEDKGESEHFWLTNVVYRNQEFEGTIGNEPGVVGNVKFGQKWTIKKAKISDWMFMRGGKMHGNYTMRPLLKTLPDEEAARYRSLLASP